MTALVVLDEGSRFSWRNHTMVLQNVRNFRSTTFRLWVVPVFYIALTLSRVVLWGGLGQSCPRVNRNFGTNTAVSLKSTNGSIWVLKN